MKTEKEQEFKDILVRIKNKDANLKEVDLNGFELARKDVLLLCAELPQSHVTSLYLRDNQIDDESAENLAKILFQTQITTLNLWGDWVRDSGVSCIDLAKNPINCNELISKLSNLSQTEKKKFTLKITDTINLTIEDKEVCLYVDIDNHEILEKVLTDLKPKFPITKIQINLKEHSEDKMSVRQLVPLFLDYPETKFEIEVQKFTDVIYDVKKLSEKLKLKELVMGKKEYGRLARLTLDNNTCHKENLEMVLLRLCKRNKMLDWLQQINPLSKPSNYLIAQKQQSVQHNYDSQLDLSNLFLTDAQMPTIIECLRKHQVIQEVNLSGNSFLQEGLKTLFIALVEIPWVTSLNLSATRLSLESMKGLKELLIKNNFLLTLDISSNELLDSHIAEIIAIIKENKSLMTLIITDNRFSKDNNQGLAAVLYENTTLTTFHCDILSNPDITKKTVEEFFRQARFGVKDKNKVKNKPPKLGLEDIQVIKRQKDRLNSRDKLSDVEKEIKRNIEDGKNNDKGELLLEAVRGSDFSKFKKLLSQQSPYVEGQEGYLQHILVKNNQEQFLKYLFDNFSINPWLRFKRETILNVDAKNNYGKLKNVIESYINKIKNHSNQGQSSIASSLTRKSNTTQSTTKKLKPDIEAPSFSATSSSTSTSMFDALITVPPLPMHVINSNFSSSPSFSYPVGISEMDILFIMQAIRDRQKYLIESKWKPGIKEGFQALIKQTPLQYAIQIQATQCIPTLISLREDINEKDINGWPLIYQFVSSFSEKNLTIMEIDDLVLVLQDLVKNGANVSDKVIDGNINQNSILHKAAQLGNYRAAKIILNHPHCPVNDTNSDGKTPLIEAIVRNHFKLVARLVLDRRHTRTTVLRAQKQAQQLKHEAIQVLLEKHLETFGTIEDTRPAGMLWSRNLTVQVSKTTLGNQAVHRVFLDKEHAWLHSQNSFTQQSLVCNEEDRKTTLKKLGNPVTASLTFILTTTPHQRQTQHKYVDITIALDKVPDYHLTQFYENTSEEVSRAEIEAVIKKQKVLNMLPTYNNFRIGYQPREIHDIEKMQTTDTDFVQTFRHGERSLITYLSDEINLRAIVHTLTQQPGFVAHAKCKGVVLNIASPRYPCENCEVALLDTQNTHSEFLPLLSVTLKNAGIQVPRFSMLRMVTCISSYVPFHIERITFEKHSILDIDFRNQDILLMKDITQINSQKSYTQFKSNQLEI